MKLIVIDLDRIRLGKFRPVSKKTAKEERRFWRLKALWWRHWLLALNENKVCSLQARDFGKKTLLKVPKLDPGYLKADREYKDAIFKLKDDDKALRYEDKMFRKMQSKIKWFRIGVILARDKACKILGRLLGIS